MKKLLVCMLVLACLVGVLSTTASASGELVTITYVASSDKVLAGADVTITFNVNYSGVNGVSALSFDAPILDGFTVKGYTDPVNPSTQGGATVDVFDDLGVVSYNFYTDETIAVKNGWTAFTLTLTAKQDVSLGTKSAAFSNLVVGSPDGADISISAGDFALEVYHTDHNWSGWKTDGTNHWKECLTVGCSEKYQLGAHDKAGMQSDASGHSFTCSVCGYEADTESHVYGDTWTDGGNGKHYRECTVCKYKNEEDHQVDETWKYNDENHYKECSVCHAQTEVTKHTLTEVQGNSAATCTLPGTYQEECLTCGYRTKAIESPALGHKWGEWTADPSNPPSCVKAGVETRKCERENCDGGEAGAAAVEIRNTDKLPHKFETYEVTTPATYLKDGVETAKCKWYGETGEDGTTCEATDTRAIPKLSLDGHLNVTVDVDAKPEFVNNKAVMDELQDTIESAVKDIAAGNEPATVKTAFIEAVRDSLSKNEGDVSVAVTVSLEEVTDPAALPEKLQKDAEGMNFEAGWKLGITALVDGKRTVEDAMDALPVPAEYALSKPEYAAPIGVQFEDVSAGCFGYPAAKKDDAFLVEAQSAGYYALFTTGDLSSDYVCYNFTDVYAYTGSAIEPKVVVTINGGETVDPKYYNVEYKDNTNVTDKAQIIITLTDEGKAAGFTLEEALTFTFSITPAPATATPKPTGSGSTTNNNGNAPETGDETNVALYAVVLAVCTAALVLVVTLRKKSSR